MSSKTNALRQLEKSGVPYTLRPFDIGDEHLEAEKIARMVGVPADRVYKTLLVRGDKSGPLFAVIPGDAVLDLKALARASGNKKMAMVPLAELTTLTGYIRGATTGLASKKAFPVFLHEAALGLERFCVSAGQRGLQVELSPKDYARVARAKIAPIAESVGSLAG